MAPKTPGKNVITPAGKDRATFKAGYFADEFKLLEPIELRWEPRQAISKLQLSRHQHH